MIDLHAHIIPGLDDGSNSEYMTLRMLSIAAAEGTTAIVAAPHCNCNEFDGNIMNVALLRKFREVQRIAEDVEPRIKVYLGMELLYSDDLPEALKSGKYVTVNNGGYALTEFKFDVSPETLQLAAQKISEKHYTPLIAHPERYRCIQNDISTAEKLREMGCGLQINSGSLCGAFGAVVFNTARTLLENGYAAAIASDAHNDGARNPGMGEAYEAVMDICGREAAVILFDENPGRVLRGQKLIMLPAAAKTGKE